MEWTKEDFESLIMAIDSELAANHQINKRDYPTIIRICNENGFSISLSPFKSDGSYPVTNENLVHHVHSWYEWRYGNKMKVDLSPGRIPILINGDAYLMKAPFTIGSHLVVALRKKNDNKELLNAIDFIVDLTEGLREVLTEEVCSVAKKMLYVCMSVGRDMTPLRNDLARSAYTDLLSSCDQLVQQHKNFGLSAWHALQSTEKMLKYFIHQKTTFEHTHSIAKLISAAEKYGFIPDRSVGWTIFDKITPSFRYKPSVIRLEEAVKINHVAWLGCFDVMRHIPKAAK